VPTQRFGRCPDTEPLGVLGAVNCASWLASWSITFIDSGKVRFRGQFNFKLGLVPAGIKARDFRGFFPELRRRLLGLAFDKFEI